MRINPIQNNPNFGIYKGSKISPLGVLKDVGKYKDYNVEVYQDIRDGVLFAKLHYVSDKVGKWVKSKLKYLTPTGEYKVIRSERKCLEK